jgi:hypothetical protein
MGQLENIDNMTEDDFTNLKAELLGLKRVINGDLDFSKFINELELTDVSMEEFEQDVRETIIALNNLRGSTREYTSEVNRYNSDSEKMGDKIDELGKKAKTTSQILMEASSGIMSLVSAWNSLASIGDTLTNEDLSPWEKFSQIMSSILMTVPMLVMGINSLKTAFTQENIAIVANTLAKGANWLAEKLQKEAKEDTTEEIER